MICGWLQGGTAERLDTAETEPQETRQLMTGVQFVCSALCLPGMRRTGSAACMSSCSCWVTSGAEQQVRKSEVADAVSESATALRDNLSAHAANVVHSDKKPIANWMLRRTCSHPPPAHG
jgi:hypothetical protein